MSHERADTKESPVGKPSDASVRGIVGKLIAVPKRGGVRLTQDEARIVVALMRERDDVGPFFVRDCARLVGLPDDALMDEIMERLRRATVADHPLAQEVRHGG